MFELRTQPYDHPDVQALTELAQDYYTQIYGEPDTDPLGAGDFTAPHGGFVIGYRDGTAVAMGGWLFTASDLGERVAQIRRMYVVPQLRRQGWAARVLTHLERDAADHGASMIILATGRPQVEAIAFYRSRGYGDAPAFGHYASSDQVVCLGRQVP